MRYSDFQGERISLLGFGAMRLPLLGDGSGKVDEAQTEKMVDYALENGVNYFDTAYPYHNGESELILGRCLKKHPRESFLLASKYPGHQVSETYDPAAVFERQLQKCGVEYFDFYLLHNVCENSLPTYLDPRWGIIEYFVEQKRRGRIRHLGFSSHGRLENLREFLDLYGEQMEFCQIQLNYVDWTLQQGKEKCALLGERNIPVWVMEPVRGGRLARLSEEERAPLAAIHPQDSAAKWAFRFLLDIPQVKLVLSGMSSMEQMEENVRIFSQDAPLDAQEKQAVFAVADAIRNFVPCTACRYCCKGCPMELDIPTLIGIYNDLRMAPAVNIGMYLDTLPEDKLPSACIGCGKCAQICPQGIDVPDVMRRFSEEAAKLPKWADICRERAQAQARLEKG